jgi:hypothetical protein
MGWDGSIHLFAFKEVINEYDLTREGEMDFFIFFMKLSFYTGGRNFTGWHGRMLRTTATRLISSV